MQLLPVMDLMDGRVVHAIAGERAHYRPIRSTLADGSDPVIVARALLGVARFGGLYVADLDAIMHAGNQRHLEALGALCAEIGRAGAGELWLDAGRAPWLARLADTARGHGVRLVPVIGSESLVVDPGPARDDYVLSLDYRKGELLGPRGLDTRPASWPRRVIVMELSIVGADHGPALTALDRLRAIAAAAGREDVEFFAAGGVRDAADLDALQARQARGALIASALHDGRLDAAILRRYTDPRAPVSAPAAG